MHLCLMQLQYPFHSLFVVNEKIACLPVFKIMWSHRFFRHFIHLICTFNLLLLIQVQKTDPGHEEKLTRDIASLYENKVSVFLEDEKISLELLSH